MIFFLNSSTFLEPFSSIILELLTNHQPVSRIILPTEPKRDEISFLAVMQALSDPLRLSIVLTVLCEGEKTCGSFVIQAPKSTLSHHFRVLRESGVLSTRRQGKELINIVRREDLDSLFPGLLDAVVAGAMSAIQPDRAKLHP
jgi:DNA-binding transcriptional ArsR family regulator